MAQHDYIISNQTFPNTRADLNNVLQAIATCNKGSSAPTTQYAGQMWIDDSAGTTWTLYLYDGSDNIQVATIDTTANTINFIDSVVTGFDIVTDTTPQLGGDLDLNSNDIIGTGNVNITGNVTATGNLTSLGIDDNATSTAVTIDSSQNVLVGTTSANATGITLDADNYIYAKRTSNISGFFDRNTTDGDIVAFKKDGTTVGSISTFDTDMIIGTGDTGLRFNDASDVLVPWNVSTNASRDANIDLGGSNVGFKDFYLTGGAVIKEATLTDGATISWDVSTSSVAKVTLGGNRTISAPSNALNTGQFVSLLVIQDGTGSRTLTWNAVYEFASDTAPTLTTTGGKGDLFVFRYNGTKWLEVGRNLNLTLS